jgi:hypothetical protein
MDVHLSADERDLLIRLVSQALSDSRVEVRRTSTPEYRDRLEIEERELMSLLQRLRESPAT